MLINEGNRAFTLALFILSALVAMVLTMTGMGIALAQDQGAQQAPGQETPQQPPPDQPSQPAQGGEQQQERPLENEGLNIDIDVYEEPVWYAQWWVWALGIAVFLVVIVALTNRGGSSA